MDLFKNRPGILVSYHRIRGRSRLWRGSTLLAALSIGSASVSNANVVGNDTQNFSPVALQPDYVSVQSANSLASGEFHLGLYVNHARNTLPFAEDRVEDPAANGLTTTDLVVGYGIHRRVSLGLALPFVMQQDIQSGETHSEFAKTGNTEVRGTAHWRIAETGSMRWALAATAGMDRTVDNPNVAGSTTGVLEAIVDQELGRFRWAVNLGLKARTAQKPVEGALVDPIKQQLLSSLAVGYRLSTPWELLAELYAGRSLNDFRNETDRQRASAEMLAALRYRVSDDTRLTLGASGELLHGIATPDVRALLGLNQLMRPEAKEKSKLVVKKKRQRKVEAQPELVSEVAPSDDFAGQPFDENSLGQEQFPTAPAMASLPQRAPDEVLVLRNINFAFDSDYQIIEGGLAAMRKLAAHVAQSPFDTLVIEGHTCRMGSHPYNENLSFRRARSIRSYLISEFGFAPEKVIAIGYGEVRPAASNDQPYGRMLNRRVEFKIYRSQQLTAGGH